MSPRDLFVVAYMLGALGVWLAMALWGRRLDEERLVIRALASLDFRPLVAALVKMQVAMQAYTASVVQISESFRRLGEALARNGPKMSSFRGGDLKENQ